MPQSLLVLMHVSQSCVRRTFFDVGSVSLTPHQRRTALQQVVLNTDTHTGQYVERVRQVLEHLACKIFYQPLCEVQELFKRGSRKTVRADR